MAQETRDAGVSAVALALKKKKKKKSIAKRIKNSYTNKNFFWAARKLLYTFNQTHFCTVPTSVRTINLCVHNADIL